MTKIYLLIVMLSGNEYTLKETNSLEACMRELRTELYHVGYQPGTWYLCKPVT